MVAVLGPNEVLPYYIHILYEYIASVLTLDNEDWSASRFGLLCSRKNDHSVPNI
jgi:hypothetical protein